MSEELARGRALVEAGDVGGLLRHLRASAGRMPVADVARLMEPAAARSGFDDLRAAAAAVIAEPDGARELYGFAGACVERGVAFLAVPVLRRVLEIVPDARAALLKLAEALEQEERHAEAVTLLDGSSGALRPWPDRYLIAYNALMAGDLARARAEFDRLPPPEDSGWLPARARLERMLGRADAARPADDRDLRGWHFTLTGGVLAELSPYGFADGMTGRYAYTGVGYESCLRGLLRLRLVLETTGLRPQAVALLPDRSGRILGLAAARLLGVPAEPFSARPGTLVVAYDLNAAAPDVLRALWERAPGQVLYEHATCWTDPPAVSADVSGLLHQHAAAQWDGVLRQAPDGSVGRSEADARPAEAIADDILAADPAPDLGDGGTPDDPDHLLAAFVTAVADRWLDGARDRVPSPGPVRSSRFA
ncbi:hypothetical protein [Actinomadura hibisca]|uniref:hypothetical protein n=1 Tax=Actinomadura hibisca TaxID=68565 RepID=UPI00082B3948|nr:hypothetical protein [Actinomadura hibisca]